MMNDTTKEYNGKNTYTNKVCHTLRLGGSWNLVTLNSRVGKERGVERGEKQKNIFCGVVLLGRYSLVRDCPIGQSIQIGNARLQTFSHAMMRQLLLYSILISYFTSKIFHFFFQQIKASTQLLI